MKSGFRFLLLGLFGLLPFAVVATHIVGGEIELQHLGPRGAYNYRLNLNLYYDGNGDPGAVDLTNGLGFFRKRDNAFVGFVDVPRSGTSVVAYTIPGCATAVQNTKLARYTIDITLNPNSFNDPGGYYISWERCCRNNSINNIRVPADAASAFYLEFPPIAQNNQPFINSSPVFNLVKGDYICLNKPFTFDFAARDPDGDSLVYTMVTPFNGFSVRTLPNPGAPTIDRLGIFTPGPYPPITWGAGFSATNAIPGTSPLSVNARTGQLSVTAGQQGLFVFSVEVVEFRNRVAIGRVRRDFQLRVIDCPVNNPPSLLMRAPGSRDFYKPGTVLQYKDTDKVCLNLLLTDRDPNQRLTIENGSGVLSGLTIAPGVVSSGTGRDTTSTQFCFDACAAFNNGAPATIRIRAVDDGCPQGLTATLDIVVQVTATPGVKPAASTDLRNSSGTVTVGSSLSFNAFGRDPQNGLVSIQAVGRGFTLGSAGMTFAPGSATATVQQPFVWRPTCSQVTSGSYVVDFIAVKRACNVERRDTTTVTLTARGLPSEPPTIRTSLPNRVIELTLLPSDTASGRVRFTVFGNDPDKADTLRLTGAGRGFSFTQVGMQFANRTGRPELQSSFAWLATCEALQGKREATYTLDFANTDGSCQAKNRDTTSVIVKLKTPIINPEDLKVPNIFTPNGDGKNDYFALMEIPLESCYERFERVEIYNRWGVQVFSSTDKAFRWGPTNFPAGTYYYTVIYGGRQVKGTLMLVK
jgi:gliding motility-associated-like protein